LLLMTDQYAPVVDSVFATRYFREVPRDQLLAVELPDSLGRHDDAIDLLS